MANYELAVKEDGQVISSMIIVAHLESGDYDYSEYGTVDAAIEALVSEFWTPADEISHEEALEQASNAMEWYWPKQALALAKRGHGFPVDFGYVVEVEEEEVE